MTQLHEFKFTRRFCPYCDDPIAYVRVEVPEPPAIGDVVLCANCEQVSIIDHNRRLRPITRERMMRLIRSGFWLQVERMRAVLQQEKAAVRESG